MTSDAKSDHNTGNRREDLSRLYASQLALGPDPKRIEKTSSEFENELKSKGFTIRFSETCSHKKEAVLYTRYDGNWSRLTGCRDCVEFLESNLDCGGMYSNSRKYKITKAGSKLVSGIYGLTQRTLQSDIENDITDGIETCIENISIQTFNSQYKIYPKPSMLKNTPLLDECARDCIEGETICSILEKGCPTIWEEQEFTHSVSVVDRKNWIIAVTVETRQAFVFPQSVEGLFDRETVRMERWPPTAKPPPQTDKQPPKGTAPKYTLSNQDIDELLG